ncbi:unnamed protein product, partial [marine sediment metagenome]
MKLTVAKSRPKDLNPVLIAERDKKRRTCINLTTTSRTIFPTDASLVFETGAALFLEENEVGIVHLTTDLMLMGLSVSFGIIFPPGMEKISVRIINASGRQLEFKHDTILCNILV